MRALYIGPEALSIPCAFLGLPGFELANTLTPPVAFLIGPLALSTAKAFLGAPGLARCQARIASLAAFKFPLALSSATICLTALAGIPFQRLYFEINSPNWPEPLALTMASCCLGDN